MTAADIRESSATCAEIDRMRAQIKSGPAGVGAPVDPGLTDMEVSAMSDRTCTIHGCDKPHYAREWCEMHYARWRRNGETGDTHLSRGPSTGAKQCSIADCANPARARGWCEKHRARWMNHGDPQDPGSYELFKSPVEALRKRSRQDGDCLIWTGTIEPGGYGQIRVGGKLFGAHRYAWIAKHGPIPDGFVIDHICHTPSCINVDHLRLATYSQNGAHRGRRSANNTSGHRGLFWNEKANMWTAELTVQGERVSKHFRKDQKDDAVKWVRKKREEVFGEFVGWQG